MMFSKMKAGLVCVLALAVVATGLGQAFYNASGQTTGAGDAGAADAPKAATIAVPSTKAAKDTQAKLQASGDFKFDNLVLKEALNNIRSQYGINIVVSPTAATPDQPDPPSVEDMPVSLELKHVPLETALRYLVKPIKKAIINQDGILVITSREKAMIRKVYPISALVGKDEDKNAQALIQVISKSIEPESWSWVGFVRPVPVGPVGGGVGGQNAFGIGLGGAGGGALFAPFGGGLGMAGGQFQGANGNNIGIPAAGPQPPQAPDIVRNEEYGTSFGDGGGASITYFPGTKALVVRQSPEAHREIEELLQNLAVK